MHVDLDTCISTMMMTHKVQNDVGDVLDHGTFPLPALQFGQELCANVAYLLHVREDDMMLPLVYHPPSLRQVWVHPRVIHEILNQHIQTAEVRRFR